MSLRRTAGVGVMVIAVAITAACTSSGSSVDAEYEPPGWMAEDIQNQEMYDAYMAECAAEHGFVAKSTGDGLVGASTEGMSEDEAFEYSDREARMMGECAEESKSEIPSNPISEELAYTRTVETLECLRSEGYDLPDLPSEAAYVDTFGTEQHWMPYEYLFTEYPDIAESEWMRLKQRCAEAGGLFSLSFQGAPTADQ